MKAGRLEIGSLNAYLDQVDLVIVGKDSIHSFCHLLPRPGDLEAVKAVTAGVQTHVVGA